MLLGSSDLSDRPKISVVMTRDSVCAGDDADAPHERTVELPSFSDPKLFTEAAAAGYLASVAGIGHTWTCFLNGGKIAEISMTEIRPVVSKVQFADKNRVHFVYHSATF